MVAITVPFASVERSAEVMPLIPSWVVVEYVANTLVEVKAVDEAYGNCEAASVEEEKKTPWVKMLELVAAVVVPKVEVAMNGYAKRFALVR